MSCFSSLNSFLNLTISSCHSWTGECLCKPGFSGTHCHRPCPTYTYGQDCLQVDNERNVTERDTHLLCRCAPAETMPTVSQKMAPVSVVRAGLASCATSSVTRASTARTASMSVDARMAPPVTPSLGNASAPLAGRESSATRFALRENMEPTVQRPVTAKMEPLAATSQVEDIQSQIF